MMEKLEKGLREECRVDHNEAVLEDVEMQRHTPAGSELAKQETLGGEQQLGEKPPCWEYMIEEENSELFLQLGKGVGRGQLLQL
jgi:hypothetical protein